MLKFVGYDIVFQEIPDEVTLAISLSGCPNRCGGCHSPHLREDIGEPLTETALADLLGRYAGAITCVCLMGGDGDPDEVARVAGFLAAQRIAPVTVGWYSGRSELPEGFPAERFRYIKLGPYVEQLGGLRSRATNQRLYRIPTDGTPWQDITARFQEVSTPPRP